ncbi:DEAD/DEAH box helicase family protein [Apilactobacillus micheneri]|uniref:DEAD/DEAH box helicase family protein n=1 Tax=Apilactobacillus micheneri TaxID=1899430 RepID=UPI000D50EE51|nr:DEAD/DEAH box helicase family protein [Apilactobacillus micheneri]GAY79736.1 RNA polymerase-associated protein RapA [Apilactobacillus micheneri]
MSSFPQFIDNKRKKLGDVLNEIAPNYDKLSIATGYWDLPGTLELIDNIKNYTSIRLLIGQEPLASYMQNSFHLDKNHPEKLFPDYYIKGDLSNLGNSSQIEQLRNTAKKLVKLMNDKSLEVRVYREKRLHAKSYIFGELGEGDSIGIIGSSNFTKAGLTTNSELNFLTDDYKIVEFEPKTNNQENGHLTWFNELWSSNEAETWNGSFTNIIRDSPVGDKTYGAYDVYIKTLMEIFPEEMVDIKPLDKNIKKILHPFQYQNAMSLLRKLFSNGLAMLSDSVGLGKTITSSAIIKRYIEDGKNNIVIMPPASLKNQWVDELESNRWNLVKNKDFKVISQQNINKINDLKNKSKERKNTKNEIDLFVIDEAHNLRNNGSTRYNAVLELFQSNPNANVLLLTATPINNSLIDFANQIQLGLKGKLSSMNVPYPINKSRWEYTDFFDAIRKIQSLSTKAEKKGEKFNWDKYKYTLTTGIRHYLVRSTRQGINKSNKINNFSDKIDLFPHTKVSQFTYDYTNYDKNLIKNIIYSNNDIFEEMNPLELNLDLSGDITQRSCHPIDIYKSIFLTNNNCVNENLIDYYNIDPKFHGSNILFNENKDTGLITKIFKIINFLGFTPYKPETYKKNIYGKSIREIHELNISSKKLKSITMQLSTHNILYITWLKRLESSTNTLLCSILNYKKRILLFKKWLNKGYIIKLSDISTLEYYDDEDVDYALKEYKSYLNDLENLKNLDYTKIKKRGINYDNADDNIYCIYNIKKDLDRDLNIVNVLIKILKNLSNPNCDEKLKNLSKEIIKQYKDNKYGNKILVFSFFSDTINYLKRTLPQLLKKEIPSFQNSSKFISGNSKNIENITCRFSPKSKNYKLKNEENEINFLFTTDVLSEGQNLQDAGSLINYDLHWNPVKMIQRNGRINRLGSNYNEILITNAKPNKDLESYLNILRKLKNKINTINYTIGNDQSVLGENINPVEFNDDMYSENEDIATKATINLSKNGDLLDWTDEYSLELRHFMDNSKKSEIKRIINIPEGKWNYLPARSQSLVPNTEEIIGLYKSNSVRCSLKDNLKASGFVKLYKSGTEMGPFSPVIAQYIDDKSALEKIKTDKNDNYSKSDTINLNRYDYIDTGEGEIKAQFQNENNSFDIKPSQDKALTYLNEYFNNIDLIKLVEKGIFLSNDKKKFQKLVRNVNSDMKNTKKINSNTLEECHKFFNRLDSNIKNNKKIVSKVKGVLFYANGK